MAESKSFTRARESFVKDPANPRYVRENATIRERAVLKKDFPPYRESAQSQLGDSNIKIERRPAWMVFLHTGS